MFRRTALILFAVMAVAAGPAQAVTIRDVIELSKAGLSDPVLLALIEVGRGGFPIDTTTMKQLKEGGLKEAGHRGVVPNPPTPAPARPPRGQAAPPHAPP